MNLAICPNDLLIRPNESFICSNDSFIRSNELSIRPNEEIFFFYLASLRRRINVLSNGDIYFVAAEL